MSCTAEVTEKTQRTYRPAVDIYEQAGEVVLKAEMPGVDEGGVDITLEKDTLTITGTVAQAEQPGTLVYSEYGVGNYRREFKLSPDIDRERIGATVQNGVLTLTMPRAEAAKGRKIEVKGAAAPTA